MYAYLQGKLTEIDLTHVVVDCGGVGYQLKISLNTHSALKDKDQVKIFTYFQVREDAHILYGFAEPSEKALFEQLISVSGVGGNTALMMLSSMSAPELYQAIAGQNLLALKRIKGIGEKTAARIVLELKDKIKIDVESSPVFLQSDRKKQEALVALANLGLPKATIETRVDKILQENADISVADIIRKALKNP